MIPETLSIADDFPPVAYEAWRALVDKDLNGAPFEKRLVSHTYEGIDIAPLYTDRDYNHANDPAGLPGFAPHTRGSAPVRDPEGAWDIRQERREPAPDLANARLLDDLRHGVTSVLLRFDIPGRHALDADDPAASGLAGADGVSISTPEDLARVFEGVHLGMIGAALEAGEAFLPASALLLALYHARGVEPTDTRIAFNADPLAVLAREGRLGLPLEVLYDRMADLALYTARRLPGSTAVRVGTAPYHHAGATAAQDLAFAMATGVEYLRALTARGLTLDEASGQLLFSSAVGCQFFLAACKTRAARRLWSRVIGASGGRWTGMRQHVRTSKRVMTARDPWVNILRNVACCYAGAIGGAESITTEPFDGAIGCPTELSARIARNTQIILQEEVGLARVTDPAGGAWFAETLTDELCSKAWAIFQEIERLGGMGQALRTGWVFDQIDSVFRARSGAIARREDAITGVSEFPDPGERPVAQNDWDPDAIRRGNAERVRHFRAGRGGHAGIRGGSVANLIEAASGGATLGELGRALPGGEAVDLTAPIAPNPYAEPFERLREASDRHLAQCGQRPTVALVNLGPVVKHGARAGFSANFFGAGGFRVIQSGAIRNADEAAAFFAGSGAKIAVLCSSDDLYASMVPTVAPALHRSGASTIVLAGRPGANEADWRAAGVDRFIYLKCDAVKILGELLDELGVPL